MVQQKQTEKDSDAADMAKQTGRDPVVLAAIASVGLSWFQFYVRGNKEHALFIGLWAPTLLAFSNSVRLKAISEKVEAQAASLFDGLTDTR